jgi:FkbM family methyltransferase
MRFNQLRSTIKNPIITLIKIKLNKQPWTIKFLDGQTKKFNNLETFKKEVFSSLYPSFNSNPYIGQVDGKMVTLFHDQGNGEVVGTFLTEDYKFLSVKTRQVVDVGGGVGETSIYFALKGAEKVHMFEPFPYSYKLAKKNIELNHLESKININLAGVGKSGKTFVDPDYSNVSGSNLTKNNKGSIEVPIFNLEAIVERISPNKQAVLKMDCEGCEYEAILLSSEDTLRRFQEIQIEYHYGSKELVKKLKRCGFTVKYTKPIYSWNPHSTENPRMRIGYIYANMPK